MKFLSKLNPFSKTKSESVSSSSDLLAAMQTLSDAGIEVTPSSVKRIATAYSCVRVLAESVGMLPISLKQQKNRSKEVLYNSPLHRLMHTKPNDFMTPIEWKELVMTHLCWRGNHYSFINRIDGVARELLPLNPDGVSVKLTDSWELEYRVTMPNGQTVTLGQHDVLHIKIFSEDGIKGLNPVQCCANTFGLAKATERHGNQLFKQSARPSGGFATDKNLSDEQYKRLEQKMDEYSGDGALKSLILEGGLKWYSVTMSNEDAQFLQTRQFQQTEICGLYRMPPHKIAILDKATFSNIEHQGLDYVTGTLMPYIIRIEERLNMSLIDDKNQGVQFFKFNVNALLRGDMAARKDFYQGMFNMGALSPNDIRDLEDQNPREGGDIYLVPMNMTTKPDSKDDHKH